MPLRGHSGGCAHGLSVYGKPLFINEDFLAAGGGGDELISKKAKEELVEEIARELQQAELIILADYRGLNVASVTQLRRRLKAEQCRYRVVKNTLTRLACRKIGLDKLEPYLEGPTAIAYTAADPVGAAKVMLEFTRENEAFSIKGGLLSGQLLSAEQVKALGEIPPREVLLARLCGSFQAPLAGLVNVLQGNIRKLVYALDAVRRLKETA
ncbi:MAG: 50S ribosomal protein L10 [Firmicutes bacterium]|jgi:large subunit ribosomal protein L10|nr:50S ribosomal protein L10 [Bacillota bacterium]